MIDLNNLKKKLETYQYPWVNPLNNKEFTDRNSLLVDLKKVLNKNDYKYVYPQKYVYIKYYNINHILNNVRIKDNKILSPLNNKWYGYNQILSHLSCFFMEDDKINILYKLFEHNGLVPKCCYKNILLEKEDIRWGKPKNQKTPHPDNILFSKYSFRLCVNDYKEIHTQTLQSPEVIEKREKGKIDFLNNPQRVNKWKEKTKNTHNNISHPWLTNLSQEERERRSKKSSDSQKNNILNGTFTPQNNYRTKRRIELDFDNIKYYFRSSWEVCFFISNQHLSYETLRIKYKKGDEYKIYIPDFIDNNNKIIYELKPKRQYISQNEKMNGAIKWCLKNNYRFIWINENNILNYINKNICHEEKYIIYYDKMLKGIPKI
jgi:hypothetical protein